MGVFDRLREEWGADFDARIRDKVKTVAGDIGLPKLGMSDEAYDALAAEVQIVVNSAAVVVFDSPLDEALEMNAEGAEANRSVCSRVRRRRSGAYIHRLCERREPERRPRSRPADRARETRRMARSRSAA